MLSYWWLHYQSPLKSRNTLGTEAGHQRDTELFSHETRLCFHPLMCRWIVTLAWTTGLKSLAATDHTWCLFTVCPEVVRDVCSSLSLDVDIHKFRYENIMNVSYRTTWILCTYSKSTSVWETQGHKSWEKWCHCCRNQWFPWCSFAIVTLKLKLIAHHRTILTALIAGLLFLHLLWLCHSEFLCHRIILFED